MKGPVLKIDLSKDIQLVKQRKSKKNKLSEQNLNIISRDSNAIVASKNQLVHHHANAERISSQPSFSPNNVPYTPNGKTNTVSLSHVHKPSVNAPAKVVKRQQITYSGPQEKGQKLRFSDSDTQQLQVTYESPRSPAKRVLARNHFRCDCKPSTEPYACESAYEWLMLINKQNKKIDYKTYNKLYKDLCNFKDDLGELNRSDIQIERDVGRTFPRVNGFQQNGKGQEMLSRVLSAFSNYDNNIGYVQGMNFIVGSLLLHCREDVTFWLFVALIEDFQMRDIYQPKLPGLYKHMNILEYLLETHLPALSNHLVDTCVGVELYASDWIFALYTNVLPTSVQHLWFDEFFKKGWAFFYRFTLTFMRVLWSRIMATNEISDIIDLIKAPMADRSFKKAKKSSAQQQSEES